jgi:hypothetical protein
MDVRRNQRNETGSEIFSVRVSRNGFDSDRMKRTPWLLDCVRTIPTERPPLVGEVSGNFCG